MFGEDGLIFPPERILGKSRAFNIGRYGRIPLDCNEVKEFGYGDTRAKEEDVLLLPDNIKERCVLEEEFCANLELPVHDALEEKIAGVILVQKKKDLDLASGFSSEPKTRGNNSRVIYEKVCALGEVFIKVQERIECDGVGCGVVHEEPR